MGAARWHVKRAERNFEACQHNRELFPEWAGTALFYSALHYVDSALADERQLPETERKPRKHVGFEPTARGRNQLVAAVFPEISVAYMSLYDMSRRTRYDHGQLSISLDDSDALTMMITQWEAVRDFCNKRRSGRRTP